MLAVQAHSKPVSLRRAGPSPSNSISLAVRRSSRCPRVEAAAAAKGETTKEKQPRITVVGLGPGPARLMTRCAYASLPPAHLLLYLAACCHPLFISPTLSNTTGIHPSLPTWNSLKKIGDPQARRPQARLRPHNAGRRACLRPDTEGAPNLSTALRLSSPPSSTPSFKPQSAFR